MAGVADVDLALLVCEAGRWDKRDQDVLNLLPKGTPIILAVNKVDRLRDKTQLLPYLGDIATRGNFAEVVPISAARRLHLDHLQRVLVAHLPEGEAMFDAQTLTDRSERFLAAEFVREKLFRLLGQEVPYSLAVDVITFEMDGDLRRILANIVVDKAGQKAMVIGASGAKLKQVGTQARLDMERTFGGRVHLELWVKVRQGWMDNERALHEFGYG